MKKKVLLVEDEVTISTIISDTLEEEGFHVISAFDGSEGYEKFLAEAPDVIVADIMMPKIDGFELVKAIRKRSKSIPVLFLTARSSLDDLVKGFELGGNDYLKKPFQMKEFVMRVKSLASRNSDDPSVADIYIIGKYIFNASTQQLQCNQKNTDLSYMENQILKRLCEKQNEVIAAQDIIGELWDEDNFYSRNSLHGFIHKLRRALSFDSAIRVLNVRGIGYKLIVGAKNGDGAVS